MLCKLQAKVASLAIPWSRKSPTTRKGRNSSSPWGQISQTRCWVTILSSRVLLIRGLPGSYYFPLLLPLAVAASLNNFYHSIPVVRLRYSQRVVTSNNDFDECHGYIERLLEKGRPDFSYSDLCRKCGTLLSFKIKQLKVKGHPHAMLDWIDWIPCVLLTTRFIFMNRLFY